jgi:4-carboxymuconolactone decarboxylase
MTAVNDYLRRKSGLEPRLVELAILVTAREVDAEYVWASHEPAARKVGLEQSIIETVKFRQPATELGERKGSLSRSDAMLSAITESIRRPLRRP